MIFVSGIVALVVGSLLRYLGDNVYRFEPTGYQLQRWGALVTAIGFILIMTSILSLAWRYLP